MKAIIKQAELSFTAADEPRLTITLKMPRREAQEAVSKLKEILSKGKYLDIEIKQHRAKRSLDANGMMWSILQQMAEILNTSKDELYLEELSRYGVFTHIIVKPNMVEKVKQEWRTVRELGEVTVNGQTGIQLQCYFGSHTYNTKEFSVLLDGVISEARDIGIEVDTQEMKSLLKEWGTKA